jgi:hypothetical protein
MQQFMGLDLDDEAPRNILWSDYARLYAIARPKAPLPREYHPAATAL